jgi:hypothetical protein
MQSTVEFRVIAVRKHLAASKSHVLSLSLFYCAIHLQVAKDFQEHVVVEKIFEHC